MQSQIQPSFKFDTTITQYMQGVDLTLDSLQKIFGILQKVIPDAMKSDSVDLNLANLRIYNRQISQAGLPLTQLILLYVTKIHSSRTMYGSTTRQKEEIKNLIEIMQQANPQTMDNIMFTCFPDNSNLVFVERFVYAIGELILSELNT